MGSFVDIRDNEVYQTVTIGTQTWMSENFRGNFGQNVAYNNDNNNIPIYGRLYKGGTEHNEVDGQLNIAEVALIAPSGWHLPSQSEFQTLLAFIGSGSDSKLKSTSGWNSNGTDTFGFNVKPGGYREYNNGAFANIGTGAFLWGSDLFGNTHTLYALLIVGAPEAIQNPLAIDACCSVRFIKDDVASPTDITLSNNTINENIDTGSTVGSLSSTDGTVPFTYTLVSGTGSTDNTSFTISGNLLLSAISFNYESKSSYTIRIRSTDSTLSYTEKQFTITILDVNEIPTDITLYNNSINENVSIGTFITNIGTIDIDNGDTFTYGLVSGFGSDDNDSFSIINSELRSNALFNYENKNIYTIRIQTTDSGSLTYEKQFYINILDVNDTPVDINISNDTIQENSPINTTIGTLTTVDDDVNETFTYTLVTGTGSTDNSLFDITGDMLKTVSILLYNTKHTYSIRVRSTDSHNGSFDKIFNIHLTQITTTDITLSNNNVIEGALSNTVIGTITAVGNSPSYTFNVVNSEVFGISGNKLIVLDGSFLDRTTHIVYPIEIEAVDTVNGTFIKSFELNILIDPEASIITFIDPITSPELMTQVIRLKGVNFTLGGSPVITIDGTIVTQLITTDTSITCLIPSLSAGIYTLNVVNGMGK